MAGHKEQGSRRPGQQERKESRVAMTARENGKGKEGESNKFGQQFCRVFLAPESGKQLVRILESLVNLLLTKLIRLCLSPLDFDCLEMEILILHVAHPPCWYVSARKEKTNLHCFLTVEFPPCMCVLEHG